MRNSHDTPDGPRPPAPPPGVPYLFTAPPGPRLASLVDAVWAVDAEATGWQELLASLQARRYDGGEDLALLIRQSAAELTARRSTIQAGDTPPDGLRRIVIVLDEAWLAGHMHPPVWRRAWPPAQIRSRRLRRQLRQICALGPANIHTYMAHPVSAAPAARRRASGPARCAIWRSRRTPLGPEQADGGI
jgi:hypothetical protein